MLSMSPLLADKIGVMQQVKIGHAPRFLILNHLVKKIMQMWANAHDEALADLNQTSQEQEASTQAGKAEFLRKGRTEQKTHLPKFEV